MLRNAGVSLSRRGGAWALARHPQPTVLFPRHGSIVTPIIDGQSRWKKFSTDTTGGNKLTQEEAAALITKEVSSRQSLESLVKDLDKLKQLPVDQIQKLWEEFHRDKVFTLAGAKPMSVTSWIKLKERAVMAPFFVLPNIRDEPPKKSYFMLIAEYKEEFVLFTFLEDYRKMGSAAMPWLSIRFFPELESTVLTQVKFAPYLKKEEAIALTDRWTQFYVENEPFEKSVWVFNKRPEEFQFEQTFPELKQIT